MLEEILSIARQAGNILTGAENIQDKVAVKEGYANFVTEYDRKVQEFLFTKLHGLLPEANFLAEEQDASEYRDEYRHGYTFVVDPIDGTSNFIMGYRISVVSIGLLKDGEPYIGVIYNPYTDELFSAEKGKGAFRNGKLIRSSDRSLKDSLVIMGTSPYYPELRQRMFKTAAWYLERCVDIRRSGSAAWDLCCVASGRAALFFELRLSVWDFAAGAAILQEAGGCITDETGKKLTFDRKTAVFAAASGVLKENYLPPDGLL